MIALRFACCVIVMEAMIVAKGGTIFFFCERPSTMDDDASTIICNKEAETSHVSRIICTAYLFL